MICHEYPLPRAAGYGVGEPEGAYLIAAPPPRLRYGRYQYYLDEYPGSTPLLIELPVLILGQGSLSFPI